MKWGDSTAQRLSPETGAWDQQEGHTSWCRPFPFPGGGDSLWGKGREKDGGHRGDRQRGRKSREVMQRLPHASPLWSLILMFIFVNEHSALEWEERYGCLARTLPSSTWSHWAAFREVGLVLHHPAWERRDWGQDSRVNSEFFLSVSGGEDPLWQTPRCLAQGGPGIVVSRWGSLVNPRRTWNLPCPTSLWLSQAQFSCSVVSDSLQPHGLQHARPPCPLPTPGVYANSCQSSRWCHPTILSSVVPFSSRCQAFPASGSFTTTLLPESG